MYLPHHPPFVSACLVCKSFLIWPCRITQPRGEKERRERERERKREKRGERYDGELMIINNDSEIMNDKTINDTQQIDNNAKKNAKNEDQE